LRLSLEVGSFGAALLLSLGLAKRWKILCHLSVSETEITKVLSQYSSVTICVSTIILLILGMVWGLRACEFVVTDKSCLLTCVSDTQRSGIKFSTASPVQEIPVSTLCLRLFMKS